MWFRFWWDVRETMVLRVHWAQWERMGSVDHEVMLDPLGLQDLQERQLVNNLIN